MAGDAALLGDGFDVRAILAANGQLRANFADPALSAPTLAVKPGLSTCYVQDLLEEAAACTRRVLKLSLQKARAMLADRRHDRTTLPMPAASTACPASTAASAAASAPSPRSTGWRGRRLVRKAGARRSDAASQAHARLSAT
jgi:hypothetical protein